MFFRDRRIGLCGNGDDPRAPLRNSVKPEHPLKFGADGNQWRTAHARKRNPAIALGKFNGEARIGQAPYEFARRGAVVKDSAPVFPARRDSVREFPGQSSKRSRVVECADEGSAGFQRAKGLGGKPRLIGHGRTLNAKHQVKLVGCAGQNRIAGIDQERRCTRHASGYKIERFASHVRAGNIPSLPKKRRAPAAAIASDIQQAARRLKSGRGPRNHGFFELSEVFASA